jgi:hypothetical protein
MSEEQKHQDNLSNALEWLMENTDNAVNGVIVHVNPSGEDGRMSSSS